MKKIIIVIASIVTLILVAAILIPVIFKSGIMQGIQKTLDENMDADVYFDPSKFDLTLFKSFPNPTASIDDFGIVGIDQFAEDTLLSVKSLDITIDVFSLFGGEYAIKSINLNEPRINVLVLENGDANYEIVSEQERETSSEEEAGSGFNLSIDHWGISGGRLSYHDKTMDFSLILEGLNHLGSGDITLDIYDLATKTTIDKAFVSYEGIDYLNGQSLFADATININLPEFKFTLRKNEVKVNDFPISFDGNVAMPAEDMEMDISFASTNSSIKSLYSLVPGTFTEGYEAVEAAGEMSFSGYVRGIYNDISMPAYSIALKASDGMISYPDLPLPIKNINMDMMVECIDGNVDNTSIEIKQMHMDMGNNPLDASIIIRNFKDYSMKADVQARLDLAELTAIFPMDGMDMKGIFSMDLKADGIYDSIRNIMPAITASMIMENGYIKTNEFPKALDRFSFDAMVDASSGRMEDVIVKVDQFGIAMEGEELSGSLVLSNLVDYQWDLNIIGDLDLQVLSEIYPIEGMKYSGHLAAEIETKGKYSDVEAERYDRFPTRGNLVLRNFSLESADLPQGMKIEESSVILDPKRLELKSFSGAVGKSDMNLDGFITNYIDYVFKKNAVLAGKMNLNSNVLDVNEWMTGEETPVASEDEEVEMTSIEIPNNIDFEFNSTINNIYYDNLHLQHAKGLLTVRGGILDMSNLSFHLLGGTIVMNGKYDARIAEQPAFDYKLNITSLSIPQAFASFSSVQAFAPMAQHMDGIFSSNFNINGRLKKDMSPVYESLLGKGLIQISEASVKDSKLVSGISGFMKSDLKSSQLTLKDVIMKASLENGRAHVSPFDVELGGQKANISGSIGADGTLNYFLSTEIEAGAVGKQVNQLLANLKGQDAPASSKIKLNFNVMGTYDKPAITLAGTTSSDGTTTTVKEEVKQEAAAQLETVKAEAEQKAKDETTKLMEKGEEQLQEHLDTLKKEITKNMESEADSILSDQLDSTANELKESIRNLFKKKKKDKNE